MDNMTLTAEEASLQFLTLLDRVAEGEQVTITRQGIPIVSLVPAGENPKRSIEETLRLVEEFSKKQSGKQPPMRELIEEGRRH